MTQANEPGAPLFAEPQFTEAVTDDDASVDVQETEDQNDFVGVNDAGDIQMSDNEISDEKVSLETSENQEPVIESDGNLIPGGRSKDVLEFLARQLVEDPDAVEVDLEPAKGGAKLLLKVAPDDMGRMIGRKGRVIQAVRVVVRAAAARDKTDATVEIVD